MAGVTWVLFGICIVLFCIDLMVGNTKTLEKSPALGKALTGDREVALRSLLVRARRAQLQQFRQRGRA